MKMLHGLTLLIILLNVQDMIAQVPDNQTQISHATMAAPEGYREGAKVYGYDQDGSFTVLRVGTNEMVCLADDPARKGFHVAAYHKDLDPYMARGRELKAQGKTYQERFDIIEAEVNDGKLKMPDRSTLYVLNGQFGEDGQPDDLYLRYVIYIPYATRESTGLPLAPASEGGPWIMDPGTHKAHIMINPPKK